MMPMKHISTYADKDKLWTSCRLYVLMIAVGILIGSLTSGNSAAARILTAVPRLLPTDRHIPIFIYEVRVFLWAACFNCLAFFFGSCALGKPFGWLMLLYHGAVTGASVTAMYASLGVSAFLPMLIVVLPRSLAFSALAILAVREALRSSQSLFQYLVRGEAVTGSEGSFRLYCVKYAVLMILSLIISAADGGLNYLCSCVIRQ